MTKETEETTSQDWIKILQQPGKSLSDVPENLRTHPVCLFAVAQDGLNLKYASAALKNDRDFMLAAVKQNRRALEYVSKELQENIQLRTELEGASGIYPRLREKTESPKTTSSESLFR